MGNYWAVIPKGVWKILDSEDAIQALEDSESRAEYDSKVNRINILGPDNKAIIIDLGNILDNMDYPSKVLFIKQIEDLISCHIT